MKIAIFDKLDEKIVYITRLATCYKNAVISTRLEFMTNDSDAIPLDLLVNKNRYIVGLKEMEELMVAIDNEYSKVFDVLTISQRKEIGWED